MQSLTLVSSSKSSAGHKDRFSCIWGGRKFIFTAAHRATPAHEIVVNNIAESVNGEIFYLSDDPFVISRSHRNELFTFIRHALSKHYPEQQIRIEIANVWLVSYLKGLAKIFFVIIWAALVSVYTFSIIEVWFRS